MKSVLRFPMLNAERDADLDYNPEILLFYGNDYDAVKENWNNVRTGVLEDERPLIDYQFKYPLTEQDAKDLFP